ncbi:MAG: FAD-dependent oxidoreductase [Planctomycetota bacterium]|jgi:renalase|nr:FAD-dependent oxidoreductase [Planctomycetota bacterium]
MSSHRIAVIGAGIAGLHLARRLHQAGHAVTVFDKARGPGGRMAARRIEPGTIDHGAQYFTAIDPAFRHAMGSWSQAGVVAVWSPRLAHVDHDGRLSPKRETHTRFVGTPRMSAITRHLARGLALRSGHRITALSGEARQWHLHDANHDSFGPFDQVYLALPGPQAQELLEVSGLDSTPLGHSHTAPCWAGMFAFDAPLAVSWDAADCEYGPVSWLARNTSKPGRGRRESWIVHANASWSQAMLEHKPSEILPLLRQALAEIAGPLPAETHAAAHRWRYARVLTPAPAPYLHDSALGLGACGDWGHAAKVEGAWLSADQLADNILACASCAA